MKTTLLLALALLLVPACGPSDGPADGDGDGGGATGPKPPDAEAIRLLEEGEGLAESDPGKAIDLLTRSLERAETTRGYLARARAKLATAAVVMPGVIPAEVAPDLEKALALGPTYTPALFFKAERLGLGRNEAQRILERIVAMGVAEDDGQGWMIRMRAATHLRDPKDWLEQAEADYGKAEALRPRDARLRLRWGSFLWKIRREDAAEKILEECVRLDPDGPYGTEAQRLLDEL